MIEILGLLLLASFVTGGVLSLAFSMKKPIANIVGNGFAILGSFLGIMLGVTILLTQTDTTFSFPTQFPFFIIAVHFDLLVGYFMTIIGMVGLLASVFGIGYMKHYFHSYNNGVFGFFYNFFLLSLFLVVTASNGLYFLFVWEIMTLVSFFLVLFKRSKHDEILPAGLLYFVMTHIGTMCLFAAFILLYGAAQSFDFSAIALAAAAGVIPQHILNTVFILMLIGFGMKAGIVPLHLWLPKAHSAAPSHVSALMSGVMIKLGIFMLFRFFLDLIPGTQLWWGIIVLVIGAFSSVLGVLYALAEHDLKRLLAYHSIENIGIILLGLGSSMIFFALEMPAFAVVAAIAGLFHTANHALFKSLLFLGSGSVIAATGTHNMERYGGLIKRMPYTGLFFLIGAVAISGLPPFNGFASEWLTFQAIFSGMLHDNGWVQGIFIFAGVALALTGGLAAACFVKVVGVTFLARPRDIVSEKAQEASLFQTSAMGVLAALCLLIGLAAGSMTELLRGVVSSFGASLPASGIVADAGSVVVNNAFATLSLPWFFIWFVIAVGMTFLLTKWISRWQKVVRGVTWDCGYPGLGSRMEITATGFSTSLITIFKQLFKPVQESQVTYLDDRSRYFKKSYTVFFKTKNVFEDYFHNPLQEVVTMLTKKIKQTQTGNLNLYILYIFVTLIGLLVWLSYF